MEAKAISSAKEVVLSFLQALNADDFKTARQYVHDHFSFDGVLGSRNGSEAYFKDMERMRFKYDIKKAFAERDDVCVLYDIKMLGTKIFTCGWYHVTENKIDSLRVVFDPRPVLEKSAAKTVGIRYIVNDVGEAVQFYRDLLNFKVVMQPAPGFAMLEKEGVHLFLNKPGAGGAGQQMPDGTNPAPGGWNRVQLQVENLPQMIATLKGKNAKFRNELVHGIGGDQILLQDPSGNLVELFEPKKQS
jgi:predicted enzyme related to lactoylglutathione lyase/limonene-1,2-epoxide hydrolase